MDDDDAKRAEVERQKALKRATDKRYRENKKVQLAEQEDKAEKMAAKRENADYEDYIKAARRRLRARGRRGDLTETTFSDDDISAFKDDDDEPLEFDPAFLEFIRERLYLDDDETDDETSSTGVPPSSAVMAAAAAAPRPTVQPPLKKRRAPLVPVTASPVQLPPPLVQVLLDAPNQSDSTKFTFTKPDPLAAMLAVETHRAEEGLVSTTSQSVLGRFVGSLFR